MHASHLVILSGVSWSGKSVALNAFEDMGYFCIDNLPAPLIGALVDFLAQLPESWIAQHQELQSIRGEQTSSSRFALLVDCRDEQSFPLVMNGVKKLQGSGTKVSMLYFDCQDDVIIRRYQESRRPHPLLVAGDPCGTVLEALRKERGLLADFRGAADQIIDTTSTTPHELRRIIESMVAHERSLEVTLVSFGFKYGSPSDADIVADVRFLPNPHFVPELRERTGLDPQVRDYVFQSEDATTFVDRYVDLLSFLIPRYKTEGKRYLTIAIGCTGGRHRSVAIGSQILEKLKEKGIKASVRHRDLERPG